MSEADLPPALRRLRQLVTVLTLVMIAGVITITALLVIRLSEGDARPILVTPEIFALPPDLNIVGYSQINGRTVIIGEDGVIRVFHTESRELEQQLPVAEE